MVEFHVKRAEGVPRNWVSNLLRVRATPSVSLLGRGNGTYLPTHPENIDGTTPMHLRESLATTEGPRQRTNLMPCNCKPDALREGYAGNPHAGRWTVFERGVSTESEYRRGDLVSVGPDSR